jgi:hypothetical protein
MPTGDGGRLDKQPRVPPPRPQPPQALPQQTVRGEEASIRTGEYALVAQGEVLKEEVSARGQGRPERRDRPEDVTHPP